MEIRLATEEDYQTILEIYAYARELMQRTGNPHQWGNNRPSESVIKEDIINKRMYVVVSDGITAGVFTFITGDDPTYKVIEGKWLNDAPYGVVHRLASNGQFKGIFNTVLDYCEKQVTNLRIDTHSDNKIMQHLLEKRGYSYCGIIYVDDGTPRLAFQLEI